jgi:hypothetical protein
LTSIVNGSAAINNFLKCKLERFEWKPEMVNNKIYMEFDFIGDEFI